ncbi:MAG: AAA family ATPase [Candidatus Methanomethylophilaceae archaeon]|jgi:cell division control protein 6
MLERASVIIKDSNKLSFDYVPVKLVCREEQMQRLSMLFRPVIENGRSETAFLTGSIGTGKTATAKRFCADMMQYGMKNNVPLDFVLINCRQRSTETGVLLQLIRHYDPGFPDRGFASSEMMRALRGKIDKEKKRLIIVLDEVDVLLKKGSIDLIYQLSRFSEENINVSASVSLILISQEYVLDRLDDASLSTFKRTNAIRFNKYTRDELREIIATRVEEALVTGGMQEDAIDLIADISSEYGDARFAIDLLDKSARIGEEKSDGIVTAEEIRAAKAMIYSVVTESKLSNLDQNHMITLLAIARSIKAMSYVQSPAAEKTYAVVCEEYGVAARKHTQFWSYVQDLEKINLIVTKTISDSNTGGRTTLISLPDIPSKVLAKKVEEMME